MEPMVAFGLVSLAILAAAFVVVLVIYAVWTVRGYEKLRLKGGYGYPSLPPGEHEAELRHAQGDPSDLTDGPDSF